MFTEEAEKSQVNRDLSQLSDAKRSLVSQNVLNLRSNDSVLGFWGILLVV